MQLDLKQISSGTYLNPQIEVPRCRICYDQGKTLMRLCECSGSIAYVHQKCIIEWIQKRIQIDQNMLQNYIPIPKCEICKTEYSAKIQIGKEEICKTLLWDNIKKLTTFHSLITLIYLAIYITVFMMITNWIWKFYKSDQSSFENSILFFQHLQFHQIHQDLFTFVKYSLIWIFFPLHYIITSILHLKKVKKMVIDESKQIIADVTLLPKQVLKQQIATLN